MTTNHVPLFYGDEHIGEVFDGEVTVIPSDDVLVIKLHKLSPLVRELIKTDIAYFSLNQLP